MQYTKEQTTVIIKISENPRLGLSPLTAFYDLIQIYEKSKFHTLIFDLEQSKSVSALFVPFVEYINKLFSDKTYQVNIRTINTPEHIKRILKQQKITTTWR